MLTLLLALALAAPNPASMLLADARRHAREGDFIAMRHAAEAALEVPGDHGRQAQLLIGVSHELGGSPDTALAMYDLLISAYPRREVPDTLLLRRANALGRLERFPEARRQLRRLARRDVPPDQALEIEVLQGLWSLEEGRDRQGLIALRDALASPAAAPWWRTQAHARLLAFALEQADHFPLDGDPDAIESALDTRAQLLELAMEQAVHIARLDQPVATLDALQALAHSLEVVGDDLIRVATYLPPAERTRRVEAVWLKAIGYVDRGLLVARRDLHDTEAIQRLEARKLALQERIEALDQGA